METRLMTLRTQTRRPRPLSSLCILSLFVAACTPADEWTDAAARVNLQPPAHLVFVGDSLTSLFPASNYVAKVRACLHARFGDKVRVTNAGVGGDYITRVQARLEKDVLKLEPKPTHVFIFLGHNDSKLKSSSGYKEAVVKPEDFDRQYRAVISAIRKTIGAKVVVLSATSSVYEITKATAEKSATAGKTHNLFGKPEALEQFNAIARKVAADLGAGYMDLYAPTRTHPHKPSLFTKDGVHINDAGNTLVALEILRYLSR
jgi:lysophospholipase L1-like esterase